MGQLWSEFNTSLVAHQDVLDPVREYMEWHFGESMRIYQADHPDPPVRRPTIGLRLQMEGGKTLSIRPGWTAPVKSHGRVVECGKLTPGVITLELVGPGKLLTVRLEEAKRPTVLGVIKVAGHRDHLRDILLAAHDLLIDPNAVSSRQADKCCCCSKPLTDVVSRTRGIGPECIRMFGAFDETAAPPTSVEKYREAYLAETGFYPGR